MARIQERSIANGDQLIESVLRLSAAVDEATARRWRGLCRGWIESNSAATFLSTTNIGRFALPTELMSSDVVAVSNPTGPTFFPAMDRLVHRGADNAWAVAVAMCSHRIAWHEGMEAENFRGVKTSQGMTYLYLADDDRHFDDEFWATCDLEAPAGTTVDLTPLPDNPEGMWGERTPAGEWTGGVTFEDLAFASMHLVGPGGTGLRARQSWLTMGDRVVALGSGITTASDGVVRTVVEHRNLGTTPRTLVVDGTAVTAEEVRVGARWAHLEGVAGYVLLQDGRLRAVVEERSGTWRRNSTGTQAGSDAVQRRLYATLSVEHGTGAAASGSSYAYVLLPSASPEATRAAVARPGLTLVARKTPGMVRLSVADPTHEQASVRFRVANHAARRAQGRDAHRVRVTRQGSGVLVEVDTRDLVGGTVMFQLNR